MPLTQLQHHYHTSPRSQVLAGLPSVPLAERLQRCSVSRRRLLKSLAGLGAGAALARGLPLPAVAEDADETGAEPQPIDGGLEVEGQLFHLYLPLPGFEPATVGDFNGWVGLTETEGMGTSGDGERLGFVADLRFQEGEYVGGDGNRHRGAFGFI